MPDSGLSCTKLQYFAYDRLTLYMVTLKPKIELVMNEMRVHFYLKQNEEKEDGTIPVLGCITIDKSMVQFSAKVSVPLSLWDTKSGRAIRKGKCALGVNGELDKMCVAIHSAYKELLEKKEDVSASEIKNTFQGISSEQETLVKHFEACNEGFRKTVGISRTLETYKRYGVSLNHLKQFLRKKYNVSGIPFQSLTPDFISAYDFSCGSTSNSQKLR